MIPITVTILAKNSEKRLREVLLALVGFDEVIVYDTGSSDNTREIAKSFPYVTLREGPFIGFGKTHNTVSALAKNRWIFSLDSDEVVTNELKREIFSLSLDPEKIYSMKRKNFYRGQEIHGCGWGSDIQKKLYCRDRTGFSKTDVHEAILSGGMIVEELKEQLLHYPFDSIAELLQKMNHYSTLFAEERKGQKGSIAKAVSRGFFAFFKSYVLKGGFRDGYRGFVISLYNGQSALWKYLKLYELSSS